MVVVYGVEMHEISLSEAAEMVPGLETGSLVAAFYLPDDAQVNPAGPPRHWPEASGMGWACMT